MVIPLTRSNAIFTVPGVARHLWSRGVMGATEPALLIAAVSSGRLRFRSRLSFQGVSTRSVEVQPSGRSSARRRLSRWAVLKASGLVGVDDSVLGSHERRCLTGIRRRATQAMRYLRS